MCSLFGWLDYKHVIPQKTLHKLTQALANAAEERGTDAAGISYIKDDKITIFKRPQAAHKIHFNAPVGTAAVMGHTRMTTQGNEKHNYNIIWSPEWKKITQISNPFCISFNAYLLKNVKIAKRSL